jgi:hypothetical protein
VEKESFFERIKSIKISQGDASAAHVPMSNIYSFVGDKDNRILIRKQMDEKKLSKIPGLTTISVNRGCISLYLKTIDILKLKLLESI